MTTRLIASPPWPAEPGPDATQAQRLAWYAAVARWAPSKHNTQPWRFVVRGSGLEFWAEGDRMLPETDPQRRELIISCGAAIQIARIAARAHGYQTSVALLPDGGESVLARLVESGPWQPTDDDLALLAAVARRRTDRGPLDGRHLPPSLPFLLRSAAAVEGASLRLVATDGDRATLASLVERADRLLVRRDGPRRELAGWLREPGDKRPDGVPADHTRGAAASYSAEFVQRDFSLPGAVPNQDRGGLDEPLIGVLCSQSDKMLDWLGAGQALAGVLLRATVAGANASYLNQPVEEPALRREMRDHLDLPGFPQLVLRMGIGGAVAPTPRREPGEVIDEL